MHPCNVISDAFDFPSWYRRDEHGKIRFSASAGKRSGKVFLFALGISDAHNQHMLCKPALIPCHHRGNSQGKTLLSQKGISSIAAPIRPNAAALWEMHDILLIGMARPGQIFLA